MMNLEGRDAAWIVAVMLSGCAGSVAIGFLLGFAEARTRRREEREAKAAIECPGCTRVEDAARRLASVGARISGVEWYGNDRPRFDPVDDANRIIRAAYRRVDALDSRDPPAVAQSDQRP